MSAPGPSDNGGFAVPPPPAKRQWRPTASVPSTTEFYGQKHGISPDLQAALQNVGRRGRQNVAMGHATHRGFERTQSVPSHVLSNSALPNSGFTTALDAMSHAHGIISKEAIRSKELQPFSSYGSDENRDVDGLSLSPRGQNRKLKFGENGEVIEENEGQLFPFSSTSKEGSSKTSLAAARKRRSSPAEPTSDTETEIDDEEETYTHPVHTNLPITTSDFPPVFQSPALTQPELFDATKSTSASHSYGNGHSRELRALPGARKSGFGKAMSAPVGRLNGWGMDIDMSSHGEATSAAAEEDGFDIKEWAESEQF
ncbi:uncharacterized protein IL334_004493 [Kwoniella shivajii]|uniref:Uncharacterized protein n=1 Tax=Kwoniella shivajii TaxID=564305 RepID=A0ABZ1D3H2_9TREE|nr:hypothetical protein IL334_004493 [Kwoniella shivajii]